MALVLDESGMQRPRVIIYGPPGVGKTTWAASAPNPIVLRTENGLGKLKTKRMPMCVSAESVMQQLHSVLNDAHEYDTLVLDSATQLDRLLIAEVCERGGKETLNDVGGGFGKGKAILQARWRSVIQLLERINIERDMSIVIACHSSTEKIESPEGASYTRWTISTGHKETENQLIEWVDCVFYAHEEVARKSVEEGFGVKRTVGVSLGGNRLIRTSGTAAIVAKNRYGIPELLPLPESQGWDAVFSQARQD